MIVMEQKKFIELLKKGVEGEELIKAFHENGMVEYRPGRFARKDVLPKLYVMIKVVDETGEHPALYKVDNKNISGLLKVVQEDLIPFSEIDYEQYENGYLP